jgi:hypothetical protein
MNTFCQKVLRVDLLNVQTNVELYLNCIKPPKFLVALCFQYFILHSSWVRKCSHIRQPLLFHKISPILI